MLISRPVLPGLLAACTVVGGGCTEQFSKPISAFDLVVFRPSKLMAPALSLKAEIK
jgi:hypothetical protein